MALCEEARQARNRYYKELRERKKKTAAGRQQLKEAEERHWLKKAEEYRRLDEAKATGAK